MKIGTAGLLQVVCQFMRRRRSIRFRGLFRALRNEFDKSHGCGAGDSPRWGGDGTIVRVF